MCVCVCVCVTFESVIPFIIFHFAMQRDVTFFICWQTQLQRNLWQRRNHPVFFCRNSTHPMNLFHHFRISNSCVELVHFSQNNICVCFWRSQEFCSCAEQENSPDPGLHKPKKVVSWNLKDLTLWRIHHRFWDSCSWHCVTLMTPKSKAFCFQQSCLIASDHPSVYPLCCCAA